MTVEVQTLHGTRTGFSVMEMVANSRIAAGTQSDARYTAGLSTGEALVVDLHDGPIFVLLTMPNSSNNFSEVIFDVLNGTKRLSNDDMMIFVRKMGAPGANYRGDLPRDQWPQMVRFRDINDPKSVEAVDPDAIGVKRIWVETTSDPVTTGIEKRLGWIDRLKAETSNNILATSSGQLLDGLRRR